MSHIKLTTSHVKRVFNVESECNYLTINQESECSICLIFLVMFSFVFLFSWRFGLVSLFNGISNFAGYLKQKQSL